MSWLEFPFRLCALSHKNICTLSKIMNAPQPYANDLFLCFENATYITSVQFWNFGDISVAVSIALLSPSPFVTQTQIPRLLKIYYPETNLLPENHSYISVYTRRKKILCWNILVEHTKGSSTDELWTIPWDIAQHESSGIYRFPQYLWVIWSLRLMKINSSISMSVLSQSLLHGTCQIIYKFDSQYIAKII